MLEELELDTEAKVKAFTHPYRMKLLHALKELQRPATPTDVARALGEGPGKVHYHMRILADAGIVALARTELVNGIVARYYEPAARRFNVKSDAFGSGADLTLRDGVAKLITLRFRDGLKAFLERTTGKVFFAGASDLPHAEPAADRDLARRAAADGASNGAADSVDAAGEPVAELPAALNARWTFGITLTGAPGAYRRFIPPLK
jgi:DNA-binding transcriptional ArsR family regulator